MINSNYAHRPSFGSLIYFSQSAFKKLPLEKLQIENCYAKQPYLIESAVKGNQAYTDQISYCTAAIIQSAERAGLFLAHLIPNGSNFNEISKAVINAVNRLRSPSGLTGLIIGANRNEKYSMNQALFLKNLFTQLNIRHSAFIGQDSKSQPIKGLAKMFNNGEKTAKFPRESAVHRNSETDTYTINVLDNPYIKDTAPKNLDDLKKIFKIVEIDEFDHIIFN